MLLYIPRPGGGYFFARRLFRRGGKSGIADIPQPKTPRRAQRFGRLPGGAGRLRRGGGVRPHCIYLLRLRRGFSAAKFFCPQAFPPGREHAGSVKKPRTAFLPGGAFFRKMCGGKGFFPPAGVICSGNPSSRLSSRKQGSPCPRRTKWACSNNP